MGDRRHSYGDSRSTYQEEPPNSRLFIICSKSLGEEDFRGSFSKFGEIEELWVVKNRSTGENKGVVYIKYGKTSEAAQALEEMNGKVLGNSGRHIKIMIASSRDQGSKRDKNEEERMLRLFVIVPKTMTNEELCDTFKQYGNIDYATVVRDRETKESKGFGYIKFFKFSHAAAAYEQCDRKFKAVFAEPRKQQHEFGRERSATTNSNAAVPAHSGNNSPFLPASNVSSDYTQLKVIGSPILNQDQLWKLFDIIPDMDYCHTILEGRPHPVRSISTVAYNSPRSAAYAYEKLHGFEYPPGYRLIVKPDSQSKRFSSDRAPSSSSSSGNRFSSSAGNSQSELIHLAETIAQATSIIKAAGLSPDLLRGSAETSELVCSVKLPEEQPLGDIDAIVEARCFVVCSPTALSHTILKNLFSRFGSLIDVYMLNNKNYGYAKYASKESAAQAIDTVHGAEVCGVRLKVMEAEERDHSRKRQRMDDDERMN